MTKETPSELKRRYKKSDYVIYPCLVGSIIFLTASQTLPGDTTVIGWLAAVLLAIGISVMARSFSFKNEYEMSERLKRIEMKLDKILKNQDE